MKQETRIKIREFTDLKAWQEGHKLVLAIYVVTKDFPSKETYSLVDQMRRAAVSITSNIAEGFGRHSMKEKTQFYYLAQGSLSELKNQLIISRDIGYLSTNSFRSLLEQAELAHRLLQGLTVKSRELSKTNRNFLSSFASFILLTSNFLLLSQYYA